MTDYYIISMTIKVMFWNPPNPFDLGHMSIQTVHYYLSIWPAGSYKKLKGGRAVETPVAASLTIHLERDIELEGCDPDKVYDVTEGSLDLNIDQTIKLFLEKNDIDPNAIKLDRVQERIQELENFIERIRSSPQKLVDEDPQTYANYVEFRRGYKTNPDDGIDLHDEMNCVIEEIRESTDDSSISELRKKFFPSEVPLSVTKYTVFVKSFPAILSPELRGKLEDILTGFDEPGEVVNNENVNIPEAMNCVTFVLFLLFVTDGHHAYHFSEQAHFGNLIWSINWLIWVSRLTGNYQFFPLTQFFQFTLIFLSWYHTNPSAVHYKFYHFFRQFIIFRNMIFLAICIIVCLLSLLVMGFCSTSWLILVGLRLTNSLDIIEAFNDSLFGRTLAFMEGYGPLFISYFLLTLLTFIALMYFSIFVNKEPRYSVESKPIEVSYSRIALVLFAALIIPPCVPFIVLIMIFFPLTFIYFCGGVLSGFLKYIRSHGLI